MKLKPTDKVLKGANGRFVTNKPVALRNGSLYLVLGTNKVARLREQLTFAPNYALLSVHDKPIVAPVKKLRLAKKELVNKYFGKDQA